MQECSRDLQLSSAGILACVLHAALDQFLVMVKALKNKQDSQ